MTMRLVGGLVAVAASAAAAQPQPTPPSVSIRNGDLIAPDGLPLYTFAFDTMVGMSHCVGVCLDAWRPFEASPGAGPVGPWTVIRRDDGQMQWAYRNRPLYTFRNDVPGGRARGGNGEDWRPASADPSPGE